MAIFLTGATGYIGSYVAAGLLEQFPQERLALLVRAKSPAEAEERLWKSMQLHLGFDEFIELIRTRCDLYLGDLTFPGLGLTPRRPRQARQVSMDSVLHVAASLNRKSSKACFNVNLRGTLSVLKLARDAQDHHGLRRFTDISTVAVAASARTRSSPRTTRSTGTRATTTPTPGPRSSASTCCTSSSRRARRRPAPQHRPRRQPLPGDHPVRHGPRVRHARPAARAARSSPTGASTSSPPTTSARRSSRSTRRTPRWNASYNLSSGTSSLTYRQVTDALEAARATPCATGSPRGSTARSPAPSTASPATPRAAGASACPPRCSRSSSLPHLQHRLRQHAASSRSSARPRARSTSTPSACCASPRRQVHLPLQPWPGGAQVRQVA
jgi:hypothetical protein